MRRLFSLAALLAVVLLSAASADAGAATQVYLNGGKVVSEVSPQIVKGNTFLPARAVAEHLGFQANWNNELRKVTLVRQDKTIAFTIGDPEADVNGGNVNLEVAPFIENGSSMLPVRFLGEQMGLAVNWEPSVNSVFLNSKDKAGIAGLTSPVEHIVVVIEENHSYKQIVESPDAPYMQSLIEKGALFTNAHGVARPSQPNYLALFSGSTMGVTDNSCNKPFDAPNLAVELFQANLTFAGYSEDMPSAGYTGCTYKGYARKHNAWTQFSNVPAGLNRPFSDFPKDFSALPTVSFVVPNHQNDMHDGTVQQADAWLKTNMDAYVKWAESHRSLLIVIWDEGDAAKDNHIPLIMAGPMVKPGVYSEHVDHYSMLRTIEDLLRLPLLRDKKDIEPIVSVWK